MHLTPPGAACVPAPCVRGRPATSGRAGPGARGRSRHVAAILAAALVLGACGSEGTERVRRASLELASRLASDAQRQDGTPVAGRDSLPSCRIDSSDVAPGAGIRLYLDATQSMAGFTGGRTGATRFDEVLDRVSSLAGLSELTLFGRQAGAPGGMLTETPFGPDLHRKATFARTHNPDYCLFRALGRGGGGVHLYLSDGVQSAVRYGVPSPTAVALRGWLAENRSLAILAFRSGFEGRAWSEQRRRWVGRVEVERRPFYLFVLAPDDASLDRFLENRLGPGDFDGDVEMFRFSPDPIRCRLEATGRYHASTSDPPWSFLMPAQQERLQDAPREVATMTCEARPGYPVGEVLARVDAEYRAWSTAGGSFGPPREPPPGTSFSAEPAPGGSAAGLPPLKVAARAPDDTGTRFGFYHLSLETHPGELAAAAEALTTDSDADPENFDRTYRFDWLLEHLVRWQVGRSAHRESFFLTLTYR